VTNATKSRRSFGTVAVESWTAMGGPIPSSVVPLQEEQRHAVYRLVGGALNGADVIAKRCPRDEADREQIVYEALTAYRPGLSVELYGTAQSDGRYVWLFLQDAAGREFRLGNRHDRAIAGRWLGELHIACADLPQASLLPDRGPDHFVEYLDMIPYRATLATVNSELSEADRRDIAYTVEVCARVRSQWEEVRSFCATMPSTFVFGDFKDDNVHVIDSDRGPTLIGFDWYQAGWGVPAVDVLTFEAHRVAPLLSEYLPVVTTRWPELTRERILMLGIMGEIFRCGASMRWELQRLEWPWTEQPMAMLRYYNDWMESCIKRVSWLR
jgi:hypothetical protein